MTDRNKQETAGSLRAGVAKIDITADAKDVKIADPLYAKALVLDDGKTRLAIIAMDTTAINGRSISDGMLGDVADDFLQKLRTKVEQELDIPGCNVLVNASHTHPPGKLLCDDGEQVVRVSAAVGEAIENMEPVKVGAGSGYEDRITMNRTLRLKNGKSWTVRHTNPCPPDEEVASLGPIDPEIGILRVDRLDGSPLAVVYNFACHPSLGAEPGAITAMFPGVASRVIQENLGSDVMALFLQGSAGDIAEVVNKDVCRARYAEPVGTILGLSALKAIREIQTSDATLNVITETIELPRRTDIPQRIEALQAEQAELLESLRSTGLNFRAFLPLYIKYELSPEFPSDYSYRYMQAEKVGSAEFKDVDSHNRAALEKYRSNISAMEQLARIQDNITTFLKHKSINDESGETTISAEVQGIKIGDCVFITSPAELLAQIGLNVKEASPYEHTFTVAYSNGYMHYGPPADYYDRGGYEVTECLLAPQWQEIYEAKANEIIRRL